VSDEGDAKGVRDRADVVQVKRQGKAREEAQVERLRKVKAEIAVLQDIVDQLES
jgi:hypothetical protein